jgi:hypothetical protein
MNDIDIAFVVDDTKWWRNFCAKYPTAAYDLLHICIYYIDKNWVFHKNLGTKKDPFYISMEYAELRIKKRQQDLECLLKNKMMF